MEISGKYALADLSAELGVVMFICNTAVGKGIQANWLCVHGPLWSEGGGRMELGVPNRVDALPSERARCNVTPPIGEEGVDTESKWRARHFQFEPKTNKDDAAWKN